MVYHLQIMQISLISSAFLFLTWMFFSVLWSYTPNLYSSFSMRNKEWNRFKTAYKIMILICINRLILNWEAKEGIIHSVINFFMNIHGNFDLLLLFQTILTFQHFHEMYMQFCPIVCWQDVNYIFSLFLNSYLTIVSQAQFSLRSFRNSKCLLQSLYLAPNLTEDYSETR